MAKRMKMASQRTIFSVVEVIGSDGKPFLWVDWDPDVRETIDANGKDTDRVIDLAEEFLARGSDAETEDAVLA